MSQASFYNWVKSITHAIFKEAQSSLRTFEIAQLMSTSFLEYMISFASTKHSPIRRRIILQSILRTFQVSVYIWMVLATTYIHTVKFISDKPVPILSWCLKWRIPLAFPEIFCFVHYKLEPSHQNPFLTRYISYLTIEVTYLW